MTGLPPTRPASHSVTSTAMQLHLGRGIHRPPPIAAVARQWVSGIQCRLYAKAARRRPVRDLFPRVLYPAVMATAYRLVLRSRGSRTPGVDGITRDMIREHFDGADVVGGLAGLLYGGLYHPEPSVQKLVPKASGGTRRIAVATILDRVVQTAVKLVLEPLLEAWFHPSSHGYRPGRSTTTAVAEVVAHLKDGTRIWLVEADIRGAFDAVDHDRLLNRLAARVHDQRLLPLLSQFLRAGVIRADGHHEVGTVGVPQGGVLSPLLFNFYMTPLDEAFNRDDRRLVRYADDRAPRRRGKEAVMAA